jgi:hypothetical protein
MAGTMEVAGTFASMHIASPSTDALEQANAHHVTPSNALRCSPLGRLPAELRNDIYTLVLQNLCGLMYREHSWKPLHDRTSISQALSITATCKQIHAETKMMIPTLNDITITLRGERTSNELGPETAVRSLYMIPPTLISPCSRIILVVDIGRTLSWQSVIRFARSIQHFLIHLQVGLSAHRWSTSGTSSQGKNDIRNKPIYPRGIPVSMNDCAYFELVFTLHVLHVGGR